MFVCFTVSTRQALFVRSSALVLALLATTPALAASDGADGASATARADAGASAADAAIDLGPDIVVTARHREENAQSIPLAVSVLGAQTIEKTGDYTLGQIQHEVPSLQVVNTNPRNSNVTIRGLGANSSIAVDGLEYGVGFYLDGVYYGRPGQAQFDLVDLQQVEVLRGPQGTLFGKNTTAGAINVTSKAPSFTPELTAEASLGNYNFGQFRVSASAPLVADKLALRLTVSNTHRDGFLTNLYDNSQAGNYDDFSIRGQLLFIPSERLKIRVIGDYSNERQHYILTLLDGYFTKFANGAAIPFNVFQRAAATGYSLPGYGAFARLGNSNSPFQANMKSYGVSGQVDYDLGGAKLTSITAYRWWDWNPANDTDGTPLSINLKGQQANYQRQFSQELRLASNGRHFIDYQAGLYYFWQTVPGYGATQYGSDFAAWNFNPATNSPATIAANKTAFTNAEADSFSVANARSYAAFGQVDVHLTKALTFTGGLRFTHEDKSGAFSRWQTPATAAQLASVPAALVSAFQLNNLAFTSVDHDNALSGLATLDYRFTPDIHAYATYSHGSKSGGLNITAGGVAQPVVAPEKVDNFEIGLKTQFLNRTVTANLAAFLTNVKDYQANITVPIPGSTAALQFISNIPKVRSKGIEADLGWSPSKWVSLTGSLAYTDAKYVRYTNAPNAPENNSAANPTQDLSGVALPGVSKFAYTFSGDVSRPLPGNVEAYLHADFLHRSSFNSTATNSVYGVVPAYGLLNARIGLRIADGHYDVSFWARNLTNENHYVSRSPGTYGLITAAVGDPRTFGATFRLKL